MFAADADGAVEACLVGLNGFGGDRDCLQIAEILDLKGFGVERVGKLLEPLGRELDLLITVSHRSSPHLRNRRNFARCAKAWMTTGSYAVATRPRRSGARVADGVRRAFHSAHSGLCGRSIR